MSIRCPIIGDSNTYIIEQINLKYIQTDGVYIDN